MSIVFNGESVLSGALLLRVKSARKDFQDGKLRIKKLLVTKA